MLLVASVIDCCYLTSRVISEEQKKKKSGPPTNTLSIDAADTIALKKSKKNSYSDELVIGIAEGGARTHDLEVDLFAVVRATRSTN